MTDISIVGDNKSIDFCILYCKSRNIICERVANVDDARGEYVCVVRPDIYYLSYYLHLQFVALFFKNVKNNRFDFTQITVLDDDEFFQSDFSENIFYRRSAGFKPGNSYIENDIHFGCIKSQGYFSNSKNLPDESTLCDYMEYFS